MSKNKVTLKNKEAAMNVKTSADELSGLGDQLAVDPIIKQELKAKNLVFRWINAKKLADNYGFDRRQWQPYKTENYKGSVGFGHADAEGYIRRGDLILAVQTNEIAARRKALLKMKQESLNNAVATHNKANAQALKKAARDAGIDAKVYEGYEENGDSDGSDDSEE